MVQTQPLTQTSQKTTYLDFLLDVTEGQYAGDGRKYAFFGPSKNYLVAATLGRMQMALYEKAHVEERSVRRPSRALDLYVDGWDVYVEGADENINLTYCSKLLCKRVHYQLIVQGPPREAYRALAERMGWPMRNEELVAEAMPLSKAPPPDPEALRLAVWAAALGHRIWTAKSPNDIAIVVGGVDIGEEWVVRGRVVIDKSSGYRLRRYVYEVIDWDYLAQDKRRVYVVERGDIAYILGGYKALRYDGAIKEVDLAEVPIEALEKIATRRRR